MSFRQKVDHKRKAAEKAWIERHWPTLKQIGLPPIVYCDYDHWDDFLENGHIHFRPDTTHFSFDQLSRDQLAQLGRFLEEHFGSKDRIPPLLGHIRVRSQTWKAGDNKGFTGNIG